MALTFLTITDARRSRRNNYIRDSNSAISITREREGCETKENSQNHMEWSISHERNPLKGRRNSFHKSAHSHRHKISASSMKMSWEISKLQRSDKSLSRFSKNSLWESVETGLRHHKRAKRQKRDKGCFRLFF